VITLFTNKEYLSKIEFGNVVWCGCSVGVGVADGGWHLSVTILIIGSRCSP